jgi:hypothetical protein
MRSKFFTALCLLSQAVARGRTKLAELCLDVPGAPEQALEFAGI